MHRVTVLRMGVRQVVEVCRGVSELTKPELVEALAREAHMTKKDARAVLDVGINVVMDALARADSVSIAGFGTFEIRRRDARTGRDPRTGDVIHVAASTVPVFRPGSRFRRRVQQ
jgi:DNA-binding protein HU-beta